MEKVIKVSIGNIAFTLEHQAYEVMQDYLDRLERHYSGSANCAEILSEIESRISELLTERGYKERVIPEETVQEIIRILGLPEDFDGNPEQHPCNGKKRLYRAIPTTGLQVGYAADWVHTFRRIRWCSALYSQSGSCFSSG